jgi:hydroxymethylglutaryl-CoA lyase
MSDGADLVALDDRVVRFVECPRDAWQGLAGLIPTERKRRHLQLLLDAGFTDLDLASFVSPRAVPQMADSEQVLAALGGFADVDLLGIVLNERGLERALAAVGLGSIGFPLSLSDTFQRRNSGRSLADAWSLLPQLSSRTRAAGLRFVVYLSMGFGNPYGDPWHPADTAAAVGRLRALGLDGIVLADTVGRADDRVLAAVLEAVASPADLGLHLHARPDAWTPLLSAALERGVRAFEGALSGIGGCPFAGDALVGNLPSERVIPWLRRQGLEVRAPRERLAEAAADAADIAARYRLPNPAGG